MKIIEGLKMIKDLLRKAEDLRQKVGKYHADMSFETPMYSSYDEQKDVVRGWLQAHSDIMRDIAVLRLRIQKTNCLTKVTIELGGKQVEKTITEWISRRKDLSALDLQMWNTLNDRGLRESAMVKTSAGDTQEVKIRRYYDPVVRDTKKELYASEPSLVDAKLEIVNATTDLVEA